VVMQGIMLVLFGVLVEYDELGSPVQTDNSSAIPDSDGNIQTFYPCKYVSSIYSFKIVI